MFWHHYNNGLAGLWWLWPTAWVLAVTTLLWARARYGNPWERRRPLWPGPSVMAAASGDHPRRVRADEREPAATAHVRAGDADRELTVARLRAAHQEGRLDVNELQHRVGVALAAVQLGDLNRLTGDLPSDVRRDRRAALTGLRTPLLGVLLVGGVALAIGPPVAFGLVFVLIRVLVWRGARRRSLPVRTFA